MKLCILLPTMNEKRCWKTIQQLQSFLSDDINLFVFSQEFRLPPIMYVDSIYGDTAVGTMFANNTVLRDAPKAEMYLLIDDDFVFRKGFEEDIINTLEFMYEAKLGVCSLICNVFGSQKKCVHSNHARRLAMAKEIPFLRKESGIMIRPEVYIGEHIHTALGEDNAKIVHAWLDGYDVGISFVNISHISAQKDGWRSMSVKMYGKPYDTLKEEWYGRRYFMSQGYTLDGSGMFSEIAFSIRKYNKQRRDLEWSLK